MANVKLVNINKIYHSAKKDVQAVFDFSIDIKDKEFIVFVGPSGCGKSTTLRMIAGLEDISFGELYIDEKYCNFLQPKDRDIAMVFQSYALYPHMSVYDNMAFGLKLRKKPVPKLDESGNQLVGIDNKKIKSLTKEISKWSKILKKLESSDSNNKKSIEDVNAIIEENKKQISYLKENPVGLVKYVHYSKAEIKESVENAAKILQITEYLDRKPKELSGGQRQRVALGRAIVRHPKVFLMDEPLSNLDAKLRIQMRAEIINLHKEVGATTIYVTHDQTEAMTMADRIVVMKDGVIQQIGTPKEIYKHPANIFVAGFMGAPSMNFIDVGYKNGKIYFDENEYADLGKDKIKILDAYLADFDEQKRKNVKLVFGIRPENIVCEEKGRKVNILLSEMLGAEYIVHFDFFGKDFTVKMATEEDENLGSEMNVNFDYKTCHIFDKTTGKIIF